jgi:transcription initiation factor IIE alpha subunit
MDICKLEGENVKNNNKLEEMTNTNKIKDLEQTIKDIDGSIDAKQKEVEGNNNFFRFFRKV